MRKRNSVWRLFLLLALVSFLPGCNIITNLFGGDSGNEPVLTLNPNDLDIILDSGDTWTVNVYALDKLSNVEPFSAISDDTSVATATKSGTVVTITGISAGEATVTISSASGKSKMLSVTVNEGDLPQEASLAISAAGATVIIGSPVSLTVTALTAAGMTDTFSTDSENTTIATVDKMGNQVVITGVAEGSTTITVLTGSGLSETISITVVAPIQEETPPPTPTGLTTSAATDTTLKIQWQASLTTQGYRLYSTDVAAATAADFMKIYEGSDLEFDYVDLVPGTKYFFYVIAYNDAGDSEASETVSRFTLEENEQTFTISGLLDFSIDPDAKQNGDITVSIYTEIDNNMPVPSSLVAISGIFYYSDSADTVPFILSGIPEGEYFLWAVVDTNYDGLYEYGDPIGITTSAIVINADIDTIQLDMAAPDRATITIGVQ